MADVNPKFPLVQFPFSAGIDEATRSEVVEAGAGWLTLENGRQDQRGGYHTRAGFTWLSTARLDGTSATAGYKQFADSRAPVRISDLLQVETWSPQANVWQQLGRVCEVDYRTVEVAQPTSSGVTATFPAGATLEDVECCNGYIAVVTQGGSAAAVQVLDGTTFAPAAASASFSAGSIRPLVASYGGRYFAVLVAGATRLDLYWVDTLNAASLQTALSTPATITPTTTTYANKPIAICSLTDRIAIAWINNSGGTDRVSVQTYNIAGVIDSVTVNTSSVTPAGIDLGCYLGTGTLWVAWNEGAPVKMKGLTYSALGTVLATTATIITTALGTEQIGISPSSATGGKLITNDGSTTTVVHTRGYTTSGGAALALAAQDDWYGANHCSKPFFFNGRHYVHVFGGGTDYPTATGNTQANLLLVDWTTNSTILRPVANLTPGTAVCAFYGKCKTVPGATATTLYGGAGATRSGQATAVMVIEYDFGSLKRWAPASFGNSTFLSGGLLSYFDGTRCVEASFLYRPTLPVFLSSGGAGSINGNYRYIAVYEDVDGDGNWSISGLSDPSAVQAIANKVSWSMSTTPLVITQRLQFPTSISANTTSRVAWYRTLAGGVAPYYRVGTSVNNAGNPTSNLVDTMLDTVLATKAKLYAQPGVIGTAQDRRPPPGLGLITSYSGMLVGACGSDIWYSGQNVQGEAAWFSPIFQVPVPGPGDIIALAVQDGTLFALKQSDIYAINGDAPSDNAAAGGLGLPRRLSCDVGAISPFTCTTALGIFFQSARGIEILSRAQTVEWIGEAVQLTVDAFPVCTGMTVNPTANTVLIELATSTSAGLVTGTGRTAVYDLSLRTWVSTDRRKSALALTDCPAQSACMIYTGSAWRYAWLSASGYVHVESATSSLDADGSFVAKRAVSASVKGSGMLGLQYINRTQLLAKRNDAHDLTMSFAYDYSASFTDARTWSNAELAAFTLPSQQLEHRMGNDAECEAVRIQLLDVTPSSGVLTTGKAAVWIGLCFEVVPRAGAYLLPDTSR